ncbi:MAG: phytanoyl-CoA dioxygenase family protein [Gammaproteobacteria bacterium]
MHPLPPRFQAPPDGQLDPAMQTAFARDGCLILEDFIEPGVCAELMARAQALVAAFSPSDFAAVFSAKAQTHTTTDYFKTSGDKIRFFFEEEAFDQCGCLKQAKEQSINKIGHALHDLDPVFERFSRAPRLAALARSLAVAEPRLLQSMIIFKQPYIGGEVTCHQDSTFLYTEPLSCMGFWFALEDATVDNGCLWAIPGRHPLKQRFRYQGDELIMDTWDASPWPLDHAIPLEAPAGTLIVLDGLLPHLSGANRSSRSRQAYALHVIDGACAYPEDNWLRRSVDLPLRGF